MWRALAFGWRDDQNGDRLAGRLQHPVYLAKKRLVTEGLLEQNRNQFPDNTPADADGVPEMFHAVVAREINNGGHLVWGVWSWCFHLFKVPSLLGYFFVTTARTRRDR
jgi:hypothetical protein